MRHAQIFVATLVIAFTPTANSVNFDQCLLAVNNMTIDGKTDNHGHLLPPSTTNATAITYELCISQCGDGPEPFQWNMFSQEFSSWLLPWLALVCQLPFGANDKLANLESMLLTVGSPTLAAYSLALTVLNGRWIAQLFASCQFPNVRSAVWILSSLQQSPVRVDTGDVRLASLVLLPKNDKWWKELVDRLDYTHTWSISAVASIAWVILAFIFTIVDYFSQGVLATLNTNGQGVGSNGSLWLWLLPLVVGWLQISPKCDSIRVGKAVESVNKDLAYVATSTSPPRLASDISSNKYAITLKNSDIDEARVDECSTPPIFNYARFLPWVQAVLVVSDTFHNLSKRIDDHDPFIPENTEPAENPENTTPTGWKDRDSDENIRNATALQVEQYCVEKGESLNGYRRRRWGLDNSVVSRMVIASAMALMLQWGTTGAAVAIIWFTPTVGLGCRSASYIIYGILSTLVWMMLLTSSILSYYSTNTPGQPYQKNSAHPIQFRVARRFSIFFRRSGKLLAALNAVWIVATGMVQFSSLFDRCYCNSSVFGLGKNAYNVIDLTQDDAVNMRSAWISGFALAASAAAIFAGFVTLFIDPLLPRPPS